MAEEAARTREQIVAAGRASFAARGFGATSTTAVAAAAGVTRGAVYHHFSDKTDLFRAVFLDLEHELNAAVTTAAAAESEPLAAVLAGCSALLDFAGRPDYQQIAVVDAPAVLGVAEWHRIDVGIGLDTMTRGLASPPSNGRACWPDRTRRHSPYCSSGRSPRHAWHWRGAVRAHRPNRSCSTSSAC
jgi:AcrR family transcriptional regulator